MSIQVGDKIPSVTLKRLAAAGLEDVDTGQLFSGKKVVLFSVPGAFTPTCSQTHLPGFTSKADELKAKGVDEIACLAVNDPFVMKAWGEQVDPQGVVTLLPDGNAELTKAIGLTMDGSGACLGTRAKRACLVVNDGVVESIEVEDNPGVVEVSGAATCLTRL